MDNELAGETGGATQKWLSISEYARQFELSDMTVRRKIKNGQLHAILQDGKYFISNLPGDGILKQTRPEIGLRTKKIEQPKIFSEKYQGQEVFTQSPKTQTLSPNISVPKANHLEIQTQLDFALLSKEFLAFEKKADRFQETLFAKMHLIEEHIIEQKKIVNDKDEVIYNLRQRIEDLETLLSVMEEIKSQDAAHI